MSPLTPSQEEDAAPKRTDGARYSRAGLQVESDIGAASGELQIVVTQFPTFKKPSLSDRSPRKSCPKNFHPHLLREPHYLRQDL